MGAILGIVLLVVAAVVGLAFYGANRWTSRSHDRAASTDRRINRERTTPNADSRGTGIN